MDMDGCVRAKITSHLTAKGICRRGNDFNSLTWLYGMHLPKSQLTRSPLADIKL